MPPAPPALYTQGRHCALVSHRSRQVQEPPVDIGFAVMSVFLTGWHLKDSSSDGSEESPLGEKILFWLALFAFAWIIGGFVFGTA